MINKFEIDGVPVTIEMNKAGQVIKALIGGRGEYVIEKLYNSWDVYFMQMGDNGPFRSFNTYTSKWFLTKETDINVIIHGLVEDGYFPNCPNWVKLNTYTPDFNAPILTRVWAAKYQPHDRLRYKRFNAWNREIKEIADSLSTSEKSFFRELGDPACDMLNGMEKVLREVEGLRDIEMLHIPVDLLTEEEYLLCTLFLDLANEISLSNDDFLIDPDWEDPIPQGSCYLEDMIINRILS